MRISMPYYPSFRTDVLLLLFLGMSIALGGDSMGQAAAQAPTAAPAAPTTEPAPVLLKPPELEALLAPIALYPDSLITQMLMASTYPLEIVQADRWAKENKALKGDALTSALEKQPWDASVKSLVNFPDVLSMMSEKLDLTIKIGDAFIEQQADVMNTVQVLRNKANAQGQLKTNEQQKIIVEAAPPPDTTIIVQQPPPTQIIKIEPTQPEVIYVPSYSPTVVYGAWAYPAYPPAPYYPPNYVASNMMSFGVGVACGAAWGYAWGNSNWGHNDVDIDVNRNTNINNNIDRSKYKNEISNRQNNVGSGNRTGQRGSGSWQHNPQHRQGVPYRDQGTANRYGQGNQNRQAAQSRDAYRGRADAGRQDLARNGAGGAGGSGSGFNSANRSTQQPRNNAAGGGTGAGGSAGNRAGGGNGAGASSANRAGSNGSSFNSVDRGGSQAKAASQRGQSSRSGSSASSGSRSSGGGSRSSGGGSRGGGGGGSRGGGGGGGRGRSDVALKENFAFVDPYSVLQRVVDMPISTWNYRDDPQSRHLGPMAQDFHYAFGFGDDDKTITFLDEGGVALAAIQGLNLKLEEKDAQIQSLQQQVAELKALVQELARKSGTEVGAAK